MLELLGFQINEKSVLCPVQRIVNLGFMIDQISSGIKQASELSCPVVARVSSTLQDVFGYTDFRPGQFKAVVAALHGHDVFV